jgi:hypothetical protein
LVQRYVSLARLPAVSRLRHSRAHRRMPASSAAYLTKA